MTKKILSVFLAALMVFSMVPFAGITAFAAGDSVKYIDADGEEATATAVKVTEDDTAWSGWVYADGEVTINHDVTLSDDTNLVLADGASLTVLGSETHNTAAISGNGKTFNVYAQTTGTGTLTVSKSSGFSIEGVTNCSVTVNGGNVMISCSSPGTGYGVYEGNVTVSGGKVTISGTSDSSTGYGVQEGNVTVNGGEVTISGSGNEDRGIGVCLGNVTVSGGKVTISGTDNYRKSVGSYGVCQGNVTVSGGEVTISGSTGSTNGGYGYGVKGSDELISVTGDGVLTLHGSTKATNLPNEKVTAGKVEYSETGETWNEWGGDSALSTYKHLKLTVAPTHTHSFADAWTSDANAHWHACTAEDCDIEDYATCGITEAAYAAHTGMEDFICDDCGYIDTAAQLAAAKVAAIAEIKALVTEDAAEEVKAVAQKTIENITNAETLTAVNEIKTAAIKEIESLKTNECEYCGKEHKNFFDELRCILSRFILKILDRFLPQKLH